MNGWGHCRFSLNSSRCSTRDPSPCECLDERRYFLNHESSVHFPLIHLGTLKTQLKEIRAAKIRTAQLFSNLIQSSSAVGFALSFGFRTFEAFKSTKITQMISE